jgi:integrative and conjugative element protein (TIGR02256 family)
LPDLLDMTHDTDPVVTLAERALAVIVEETQAADDGCETGGILLGAVSNRDAAVRHAGRPGPAAIRTPTSFLRDLATARAFAEATWAVDRSQWIGEWHTHPGMSPIPSTTDVSTYADFLDDPALEFAEFISVIVTPTATGPVLAAWWCGDGIIRPATVRVGSRTSSNSGARVLSPIRMQSQQHDE